MTFFRSIDTISRHLLSSDMLGKPESVLLENILLNTFFLKRDGSKNQELLTMSHTINNLLTPFYVSKSFFEDSEFTDFLRLNLTADKYNAAMRKMRMPLGSMMDCADRIKDLVASQMSKELAKIYNPAPVTASELITDARKFYEMQNNISGKKNIEFTWTRTDQQVFADKTTLQPVFLDLVKNAYEAIPVTGQIRISMSDVDISEMSPINDRGIFAVLKMRIARTYLRNLSYRSIDVYNSGPHLTKIDGTKTFALGYTTKNNGHGVGMTSVINKVEDSRGFLSVRNCFDGEKPAGVAFSIYLPTLELADFISKLPTSACIPGVKNEFVESEIYHI